MKKDYVLTNGKKFIKLSYDGQYQQVNNASLADTFKTQKAAKNFMLNSIPKQVSREYYVAKIEGEKIIQCMAARPQKPVREKYDVFCGESKNLDNSEWCKNFIGLDEVFAKALKRGSKVAQELSDIDLEISDLEHYIEFTSLDAFSGYKAYKKLRELLVKRRHLKDEHKIINAINNNHIAKENIINILSVINECKTQHYTPRKTPELFEFGIDFDKRGVSDGAGQDYILSE